MSSVENTNYVSKNQTDSTEVNVNIINCSLELDNLAEKITSGALQDICDAYVPRETKSKARLIDLLSAISAAFKLINLSRGRPVFLVQEHYNWESASGFYFFIGTLEEVKQKLTQTMSIDWKLKKSGYVY